MMKYLVLFLLSANAFAGFPPTTTKVIGDTNPVTTFQLDLPNFTATRVGTKTTLNTLQTAGGGTGLTTPGAVGNVLTSNGASWVSSPSPSSGVLPEFDIGDQAASVSVDWLNSQAQRVRATGNITISTPTNPTNGKEYQLKVVQDNVGSRTVAWPTNFLWPSGTPPTTTATADRTDLFKLYYDGVNYFGHFFLNYVEPLACPWGTGSDGVLNIASGTTSISLAGNVSKSYSSVTVAPGATLEFTGSGWASIGVCGNFNNSGTIKAVTDGTWNTTVTATAPDSTALSYTVPAKTGGDPFGASGLTAYGNGGGGTAATSILGGQPVGETGNGTAVGLYGNNGLGDYTGSFGTGGGGTRGYSGAGIYIKVAGNISGNGAFVANGRAGGNGHGGQADEYGGGGGAGGSGGFVLVRYHGSSTAAYTSNVAAGSAGAGGVIGSGDTGAGSPGQAGNAGTYSLSSY
jgi:hypothetical protein